MAAELRGPNDEAWTDIVAEGYSIRRDYSGRLGSYCSDLQSNLLTNLADQSTGTAVDAAVECICVLVRSNTGYEVQRGTKGADCYVQV